MCRRRLGDMHYYGDGVLVNYTAAAFHYLLNLNDPQSCFNLVCVRVCVCVREREGEREKERESVCVYVCV